jgi:hypothetical protein
MFGTGPNKNLSGQQSKSLSFTQIISNWMDVTCAQISCHFCILDNIVCQATPVQGQLYADGVRRNALESQRESSIFQRCRVFV